MWYVTVERAEMMRVALVGLIVGLLTPALGWVISNVIINPIFCSTPTGVCNSRDAVGYGVSMVLVAAAATAILALQNVYRPLLVTLAATVALWGLGSYLAALAGNAGFEYFVFSALLFTVAYVACYWLLRVRNFAVSVVALLLLVVVTRWMLIS